MPRRSTFYGFNPETNSFEVIGTNTVSSDSPYVIQDSMDPTLNHCDGEVYDSRSKFYDAAKREGCIEVDKKEMLDRVKSNGGRRTVNFNSNPWALKDSLERVEAELRDGRRAPFKAPEHVYEMWRKLNGG